MAGGWIMPSSAFPVTSGNVFPNFHRGAGANSKEDEGLGVAASIAADSTWRLRFPMPPAIPSGTPKIRVIALANATSGVVKINPKWASVAMGVSPSGASLSAEGTTADSKAGQAGSTATLEFGAADNDQYLEAKWDMNATTVPAANEVVILDLTFETSGWTLAQVLTCRVMIGWE